MSIKSFLEKSFDNLSIDESYPREKRNFSNSELLVIENFFIDIKVKYNEFKLEDSKREIIENYNSITNKIWFKFGYLQLDGPGGKKETATEAIIKSYSYNNNLIQFSFTKHWLNKLNDMDKTILKHRLLREDELRKYTKLKDIASPWEFAKEYNPKFFTAFDFELRIGGKDLEEKINLERTLPSGFYKADYQQMVGDMKTRYLGDYDIWDKKTEEDFNKEIYERTFVALETVFKEI